MNFTLRVCKYYITVAPFCKYKYPVLKTVKTNNRRNSDMSALEDNILRSRIEVTFHILQ